MASRTEIQYVRFYTDGSAARKISPAVSAFKAFTQPQIRKKKRVLIHVDPVAILSIAVAVCMLVCIGVGVARTLKMQEQTDQMQRYLLQLQEQNASLQEEYDASYDLQNVKQTALALGMIPKEQAQRITLEVELPPQEQTVTLWSRIGTFLAGLLA